MKVLSNLLNLFPSRPPVIGAMLRGSFGFAGVSLAGFSIWAVAGKWFYGRVGEAGLYGACLLVFLGMSGLLLHPLVASPPRLVRSYLIFIPAFLAYAVVWCGAWFVWHFGLGEWLGSFLGSIAFTAVVSWSFRNFRGFAAACAVLFCLHSVGYFLGGKLMYWLASPDAAHALPAFSKAQLSMLAKLVWGLLYGLGFGAGIGFAFSTAQEKRN